MSISFSCECGKRLKVGDNLLGKKVKCPDCQKVTVVTADAGPVAKPVAKPVAAPVKAKAAASKRPADDEPDMSDFLNEVDAGLNPGAKPAKKKPGKPALDENLEPDLSSLLGDEDEDTPKPAKKKPIKKVADEDEEPDLSSLLGDDDEDAPKSAKKKPGKQAADEDEEPDLSSLLGDDDDDTPPAKKGKSAMADDDDAIFDDDEGGGDEEEKADDEDEAPAPAKKKGKKSTESKKSSKKLLIIIGILVLLLGGAGATVFFVFPDWIGMGKPTPPPPSKMPPMQMPMPMPMPMKDKSTFKKDDSKKDDAKKDNGKDEKKDPDTKDPEKKDPEKKDPEKKDPDKKFDPNPTEKEIEVTANMKLVRIEPGKFAMGSPANEKEREPVEDAHPVEITQPFYLGKFEVSQAEYEKIMGSNPSKFKGDKLPVDSVLWEEAKEFCKRLSDIEGRNYTLPTEAEWEFACRAGTKGPFSFGATLSPEQANYNGTLTYGDGKPGENREKTTDVGSFPANAWGLHDMHGNVAEWCEDRYGKDYYKASPVKDPKGPELGEFRCVRGGSWASSPASCRSAFRYNEDPKRGDDNVGFRVVLRLPKGDVKEEPKKDDEEPKKDEPKKDKVEPNKDKDEPKDKVDEPKKATLNLKGHEGAVSALVVSADGKSLFSGAWGPVYRKPGDIKLWDVKAGKETLTLKGHLNEVTSIVVSPDSKRLYSGSDDQTILVWDLQMGKQISKLQSNVVPTGRSRLGT